MIGPIALAAILLPAAVSAALAIHWMAEIIRAHRAHRGQR